MTKGADYAGEQLVEVFHPPARLANLPAWLARLVHASRGCDGVILRGTSGSSEGYRDLLAAVVLRVFNPRTRVVVSDATIEPGSKSVAGRMKILAPAVASLSRILVKTADGPQVTWCVLSTEELTTFPRTWGVDPERVVFTPFTYTAWKAPRPEEGHYVFSGGNSLRDYDLLLRALEGSNVPAKVATAWGASVTLPNVEIKRTSHQDFLAWLAAARAVVLPLMVSTRSTGQQTYLNAMVLGKPVIVTEAPGVRDYIENGVTGVIVPHDEKRLREALEHVMHDDNANFYRAMGERARVAVIDTYTDARYRRLLLELALGIAGKSSR